MHPTLRHTAVTALVAAVLLAGFCLPSLSFLLWDHNIAGQVMTEDLQMRPSDRESLTISHMLRMAYATDKQTILSKGKYFTPEEAFAQAKLALSALEHLESMYIDWDTCVLQDYSIMFRISSEDLSKRMILWSLTISAPDGVVMRLSLEDRTGMVLGFSYSNPQKPFHTSSIPPAESQIIGQTLIDLFTQYWEVTVSSTTVVSDSGGYLLTVYDATTGLTTEIPYFLDQTGIRINSDG